MSVIIKNMDLPKSCDVCDFVCTNDSLPTDHPHHSYCGFPGIGEYVTDYIGCRHPDCPLSESVDFTDRETNLLLALLLTERTRLKDAYQSGSVLASLALTQTLNELDAVVKKLDTRQKQE